jgi:hypothetical protein
MLLVHGLAAPALANTIAIVALNTIVAMLFPRCASNAAQKTSSSIVSTITTNLHLQDLFDP